MKPFGMSGAWRIYVPTPYVARSRIGEEALRVNRYASWPVTLDKVLVRKASSSRPVATEFKTSALRDRFAFVNLSAAAWR
jgi:hypothetical protein